MTAGKTGAGPTGRGADEAVDLVVQHPALDPAMIEPFRLRLGRGPDRLDGRTARWRATRLERAERRALGEQVGVDVNIVDGGLTLASFGLLAMDMDSTLITVECIDELADFAGRKAEVAAITEAAMQGVAIDYADSLGQRLAVLAGLPASVLDRTLAERIRPSPGASALLAGVRQAGLATLLVSGGFTWFTDRLAQQFGIDRTRANRLEIIEGRLSGRLAGSAWGPAIDADDGAPGPIVDAAVKRETLEACCAALGLTSARAIAIGDGSNDLPMLRAAGLAIGWRAKAVVRDQIDGALDHCGLDAVLDWFEPAGKR